MKTEGIRSGGKPMLSWKYTVRRDMTARKIRKEWATDRPKWKCLYVTRIPAHGESGDR